MNQEILEQAKKLKIATTKLERKRLGFMGSPITVADILSFVRGFAIDQVVKAEAEIAHNDYFEEEAYIDSNYLVIENIIEKTEEELLEEINKALDKRAKQKVINAKSREREKAKKEKQIKELEEKLAKLKSQKHDE